ncbi:MAG: hypothetical protein ACRDTJ_08730 [Pseudonocardiaceae bacterium]
MSGGAGVLREAPDESANGEVEHPLPEGVFHLISAHEVVPKWRLHPAYVALCGERVETAWMSETDCPNKCECEFSGTMVYCPACLREAIGQNRRAGVDVDCSPGVIVRAGAAGAG